MADRLKSMITDELEKLVADRDECRRKSLQFKDAAEKFDKQVNRLQHFLADYGTDSIDLPDMGKSNSNGSSHKGKRVYGVGERVSKALQDYYPQSLSHKDVCHEVESDGFKAASIRSALERMIAQGKAVKMPDHTYQFVLQTVRQAEMGGN